MAQDTKAIKAAKKIATTVVIDPLRAYSPDEIIDLQLRAVTVARALIDLADNGAAGENAGITQAGEASELERLRAINAELRHACELLMKGEFDLACKAARTALTNAKGG